jgi:hypothetical protein
MTRRACVGENDDGGKVFEERRHYEVARYESDEDPY